MSPKVTIRVLTLGYWLFLSHTLLSGTPWDLIGGADQLGPHFDPSQPMPSLILHILAYGVLGSLLYLSFRKSPRLSLIKTLAILHAIVFELLQGYVPTRWTNPWDMAANTLGLFLGWSWLKGYWESFLQAIERRLPI